MTGDDQVAYGVAKAAADPEVSPFSGRCLVAAELAAESGFTDVDGTTPTSVRDEFAALVELSPTRRLPVHRAPRPRPVARRRRRRRATNAARSHERLSRPTPPRPRRDVTDAELVTVQETMSAVMRRKCARSGSTSIQPS